VSAPIAYEVRDDVATLTLNRPLGHNSIDRVMAVLISQYAAQANTDDRVRVFVLAAAGKSFCAGGDFKWALSWQKEEHSVVVREVRLLFDAVRSVAQLSKPTIARVQGPVMGGGVGLMLACDFVVATVNADIGLPSVRNGLVAGLAVPGLIEAVGMRRTRQMLSLGPVYSAEEAARIELVDFVCAERDIDHIVGKLCTALLSGAPGVQRAAKNALATTYDRDIKNLVDELVVLTASTSLSSEAAEGMSSFLAKRRPSWRA
jgi:methylglutaconyl-CoA hydratase